MADLGIKTKRQQVTIDIDKLENLAKIGVRGAAPFMGLGLNAAGREPSMTTSFTSYR